MRKLFGLLFVAGMLVFASCGTGKQEAATTDSVVVEEQPVMVDTTATAVDTTVAE